MALVLDTPSTGATLLGNDDAGASISRAYRRGVSHDTLSEATRPRMVTFGSARGEVLQVAGCDEEPRWLRPLAGKIAELNSLRRGWNSHNAAPVPRRSIFRLIELVVLTMKDMTPFPHITPLSSGGIQVEWHERGMDIEASIDGQGAVTVWYEDSRTGKRDEFTDTRRLPRLATLVSELTRRA